MLVVDAKYQLNRDEVDFFVANGYLGPYAAMPPDDMAEIRREIEEKVLASDGPNPRSRGQSRHMDQPAIYDLATHPAIIERIACLLGPDLVVWATNLWLKNSGGVEIPWHQDINFWPLEPPVNTSAWIAIDDVTVENACVKIIPGSHRASLPHTKAEPGMAFGEMAGSEQLTMFLRRSIWSYGPASSSYSASACYTGRARTIRTSGGWASLYV